MNLKGKEILVVDDDTQYHFFIKNILGNLGINIIVAIDYNEAVEHLKESTPHLIITDVKLNSDKTGLDVQRYLKNNNHLKDIPVFVITADASKATIFQSLALGAEEYILKPVKSNELIQKVRRAFLDYQTPEVSLIDESSGKYKAEFKLSFEDNFDLQIETDINLRAINELSCILQGPVKFPKETIVEFNNDLIMTMGGDNLGYRSIENSRTIEAGTFSTRFSLVGIDEKTAQNIRKMRVTKK